MRIKVKSIPTIGDAEQFPIKPGRGRQNPPPESTSTASAIRTGEMFMDLPVWRDGEGEFLVVKIISGKEFRANPGDWVVTIGPGDREVYPQDTFWTIYEPCGPANTRRTAWLIENGEPAGAGLMYLRFDSDAGCFNWHNDPFKALHLSRRQDAEIIARECEEAWKIVEHIFND